MNNKINEVQRQYFYAVQPVKLFETQKQQQNIKNFDDFNFISTMKQHGNNPFHPDVSYTNKGQKLDILS